MCNILADRLNKLIPACDPPQARGGLGTASYQEMQLFANISGCALGCG